MRKTNLALAILLGLGLACDSKDAGKKDAASVRKTADGKAEGEKAEPAAKAEPAGPAVVSLDKVGLEGKAPAGANVSDGIGGGVMVQAPGLVVTVSEAPDDALATADKAKEDADMYSPQNWKAEEVEGGYVATFENKGGMGTNFWVKSYRKIGDKAYLCDTTASDADQQKNAAEFCKSLTAG
jgi:hypothetical protein